MLHTQSHAFVCVCMHVYIMGFWRLNTLHMQWSLYMRQQVRLVGELAAHKYDNTLLKEHGFQLSLLFSEKESLLYLFCFFPFVFQLRFASTHITEGSHKPTRTSGLLQMKSPYRKDLSQHGSDSHGSTDRPHCSGPSIKAA